MSPKPFVPGTSHPYSSDCSCSECDATWLARVKQRNPHLYGYERRTPGLTIALRTLLVCVVIGAVIWAAAIWWAANAFAVEGQVQPVRAPASLLRARAACPNDSSIPACRAALRRAYDATAWQKHARLHQGAYGVDHALRLAAALYNIPLDQMRSVSSCESHGNPQAKNLNSTATGLFQWLNTSWASQGIAGFPRTDPYASALAAARAVTRDHGWSQWVCKPHRATA